MFPFGFRRLSGIVFLALLAAVSARAQSTTWDSLLTGSQWYVPAENLLSYLTQTPSLNNPTPAADQTIWTLGIATSGTFSGTSVATFQEGSNPIFTSTTTMNGVATDSGQVFIIFTQPDTPATIGSGQIRTINETTFLEMQMITGEDGLYITHWAYMAPYDGDSGSLPPLEISPSQLTAPEWNWMAGTTWNLHNDDLFGTGGVGTFSVASYVNGYYWGSGTGPEGSPTESFTFIGSATPEGNILFNILSGDTLTSLIGQISGTGGDGTMFLRSYSAASTFGNPGIAQVVPEPSAGVLVMVAGATSLFFSSRRRSGRRQIR